ncbi:MAG: hypothetical protein K5744_03000 [Eubacterium sp.]|nr:hypothetical protein [Eubacterium sp.]
MEREGLSAFTEIDERSYSAIAEKIDFEVGNSNKNIAETMKLMLKGGEPGSLGKLDINQILQAHEQLNKFVLRGYKDEYTGKLSDTYSIADKYAEALKKESAVGDE